MPRPRHQRPWGAPSLATRAITAAAAVFVLGGCSVKQFAIKQVGSALASSAGGAFAAESDPEFAGQAVPFSLKLVETLIWEQPENDELLMAAAGGFTQYAFVWVQQPADLIEADDFAAAQRGHLRARAFYLRAHDYAMRGLAARHKGFAEAFARDPFATVKTLGKADVPLMYWACTSLGAAISLGKTEPDLVARQPQVEALVDRAAALDPGWGDGALREFLMAYELARPGAGAEGIRKARALFEQIVAETGGQSAGTFVVFAESVSVQQQNRAEFTQLLQRALAIDTTKTEKNRLANVVMQERARWLLSRADELFLE
jgi:predicted anti-sigma-YlaC factor YlaD